jgi:8-oxo-dGTP pyrophosphatase MutT (NUDIX family)
MWLFTPVGFFSAVRKPGESELTICARVRADLDALRARALPELGPTSEHEGTDYPYRAHVAPQAWGNALAELGSSIDYGNFEDAVHGQQGAERADTYLKVWHVLHGLGKEQGPQRASLPPPTPRTSAPAERAREPQASLRRAYGGVVIDGEGRVLLRERAAQDAASTWTFAEGLTMAGERDIDAARRAVLEQTGLRCAIITAIPGWFVGESTASRFFLMSPLSDTGRSEGDPTRLCWASFAESAELVGAAAASKGRERDLAVLREAERVWRIGAR